MAETLIRNGTVVTMNERRDVYDPGAVAVAGDRIVAVGPDGDVTDAHDADTLIDASGHIVVPGLLNTHVHVPDVLSRGIGKGRALHDWLFNVKRPFVGAMTPEDHALAAAVYCRESLGGGITTFVENAGGTGTGYDPDTVAAKLDVYDRAGTRTVYAHGFVDQEVDGEFADFVALQERKEPGAAHVSDPVPDTESALDRTERLIEQYHGTADGRQSVWPGPFLAWGVSPEGLAGAYELAERHDVMTTTHTAESAVQERNLATSVEYLESAGYLGERTLLGHCVQVTDRDVRRLAATDTKVAHNVVTNLVLGSGVAPVPEMLAEGVTVGLGTDNANVNDTVNLLSDMRTAATVHKGVRRDTSVATAADVFAMATIDAARAIGREADLGSLESGKRADIVLVDTDAPQLTPCPDPVAALVYQAHGTEVDTVLCDGDVVVEDGSVVGLDGRNLGDAAERAGREIADRAGLTDLRSQ